MLRCWGCRFLFCPSSALTGTGSRSAGRVARGRGYSDEIGRMRRFVFFFSFLFLILKIRPPWTPSVALRVQSVVTAVKVAKAIRARDRRENIKDMNSKQERDEVAVNELY